MLQHQWCWSAVSDSMYTSLGPHHQLLQSGRNSWIQMLQEENLTFYTYIIGDGCWFDLRGWPGRVGAGYCKSMCRHIWQRYSRKWTHCVYTHLCFDVIDALENLALYACVGGRHMLHKFATISLFLLSSSYYVVNCLWVLLVFVGAHTPDTRLLYLHEILVLISQSFQQSTMAYKTCYWWLKHTYTLSSPSYTSI